MAEHSNLGSRDHIGVQSPQIHIKWARSVGGCCCWLTGLMARRRVPSGTKDKRYRNRDSGQRGALATSAGRRGICRQMNIYKSTRLAYNRGRIENARRPNYFATDNWNTPVAAFLLFSNPTCFCFLTKSFQLLTVSTDRWHGKVNIELWLFYGNVMYACVCAVCYAIPVETNEHVSFCVCCFFVLFVCAMNWALIVLFVVMTLMLHFLGDI